MATMIKSPPTAARCPFCNTPAHVTVESPVYRDSDPLVFKAPIVKVEYFCNCNYSPQFSPNLQPATRKEPTVTEKQYSTDATKNAKLKAVSDAFQSVEETLLTNSIDAINAATRATTLLNNALQRLDRELLQAGQVGITFDEIAEAFPTEGTVLTNRLEAVWQTVNVDNLENVS